MGFGERGSGNACARDRARLAGGPRRAASHAARARARAPWRQLGSRAVKPPGGQATMSPPAAVAPPPPLPAAAATFRQYRNDDGGGGNDGAPGQSARLRVQTAHLFHPCVFR